MEQHKTRFADLKTRYICEAHALRMKEHGIYGAWDTVYGLENTVYIHLCVEHDAWIQKHGMERGTQYTNYEALYMEHRTRAD
jgi:hypothetical protein